MKWAAYPFDNGAPTMIRTWDPQIRNLVLYPTELPGLGLSCPAILGDFPDDFRGRRLVGVKTGSGIVS